MQRAGSSRDTSMGRTGRQCWTTARHCTSASRVMWLDAQLLVSVVLFYWIHDSHHELENQLDTSISGSRGGHEPQRPRRQSSRRCLQTDAAKAITASGEAATAKLRAAPGGRCSEGRDGAREAATTKFVVAPWRPQRRSTRRTRTSTSSS